MTYRLINIPFAAAASMLLCASVSVSCSKSENHDDHVSEKSDSHEADGHGHHHDLIEFDDSVAAHFGVVAREVRPADFHDVILVSGQIETKASDEAVATAGRSGILTLSPDINTGSIVSAGTPIARISASGVQNSDPTLTASAAKVAAKRELDRLKPLHDDGIVSDEVYNSALRAYEEADAALRSSSQGKPTVVSPKSGVITQLLAKSGEYVEAGQQIAVISGNTNLTLRADVPEKYMPQIQRIESANFRPASSDKFFSIADLGGRMISNPGSAVVQNGFIPIYFVFNNNGATAPGSFAEIYLKSGVRHDVMSVPIEAIVEVSGNKCVYASLGNGHFAKHVVTTGASDGKNVEITSGLHKGEKIVVKGAPVVRMAETSSQAVPGHTHNH